MSAGPRGRFQRLRPVVHGYVSVALSNLLGGELGAAQSRTAHGWTCRRICAMRHNRGTRKRRGERWQLLWFWNAGREICGGACAMDRLCDWVHRYNELGLQDPFDRSRRNGPVIALSTEPVVCPSSAARRGMAGSRPHPSFSGAAGGTESGHAG